MHQTAAFYEQNVNSISCHLLINDHYKNSLKGCRLFLEDSLYLWWEEGDDGCKIGGETKESEAGEDHTLAPELELFPHLIIFFLSLLVLWEIKPHRTRNRIASTPVRQNFWESTPCKEHLHFFVGFFFTILDINWFARILDWTTSTLLSANFDVKDPFDNLKIESTELFLKILSVASYCWKSLWKLVCHAY